MKNRCFFALFFPILLCAAEDVRFDGLIFHHSFESADMSADFAAGEKKAKVNDAILTGGISGKGLLVGNDDKLHNIQFPAKGNFNKQEGSVSFWMKPVDYRGNLKGWIFLFDAAEPSNQGFRFYKYNGPNGFFWFTCGRINKAEKKTDLQIIHAKKTDFKPGEWHHIALTWRSGGQTFIGKDSRQRLYVDGKLTQERPLPEKFIPETIPALFTIGPSCRWGGTPAAHTVIDEFKIYSRELSADQIRAEYYRFFTPETTAVNTLNAAPADPAPVMDNLTAWKGASEYNVFFDNRKRWTDALPGTSYFLAYDRDNLYIRIVEKLNGRRRVMTRSGRDGELYLDDCWEVYVGAERNETCSHYVFNGSGDVYDGRGLAGVWNGNAKHKALVTEKLFCLDIAIPAKDLDMPAFKAGDKLVFSLAKTFLNEGGGRTFYSNNLIGRRFHDYKNFSTLHLAAAGSASGATVIRNDAALDISGAFPGGGEAVLICSGKDVVKTGLPENAVSSVKLRGSDIPLQYELKVVSGKNLSLTIPFTRVPDVLISFEMDPDSGELFALFYPASLAVEKALSGTRVEMTFIDKSGKVTARKKAPFGRKVAFSPKEQPAAGGIVRLSFTRNGREVLKTSAEYYHIDYAAWRDYDGGMNDDDVPAPWTPAVCRNGILECWSRSYDFSRRALPDQLVQAGHPLLRDKAAIRAVIGGKNFDLSDLKLTPSYASKGKYTLKGGGEIAGCRIDVSLDFEFDGFTLVSFQIDRKNTKIDRLYLEFPMRKELSVLKMVPFLNEKGVQKDDAGFVKDLQRWKFTPGIWVGNDERDLTWFSESDEFFHLKDPGGAIELTRNVSGEATLRINFIDHADAEVGKHLKYVFGFQVTPLKPFPEPRDWMNYAFVSAPNAQIFISGWNNRIGKNYQGFPGSDGCMFAEAYAKENLTWVGKLASGDNPYRRPMLVIRYLYPNMCASTLPEYNAFRSSWVVTPSDVWGTDGPEVVPSVRVSPMARSWANFYCWRFDRYFAATTENGMYQDFCHPIKDTNALHGAGYVRDGKRYPTYCLYKFREIQKRLYRIGKKYETPKRRIFFIGHTGGSFILPHANFFSLVNEGEYLGAVVNTRKPYLDFFDQGRWVTEFNGRQFGLLCNFIPSRGRDLKFTNEIFALVVPGAVTWMLHTEINKEPQQRVYKAYSMFGGYRGVDMFLPYWNNGGNLSVSDPEVKATLLVRGKKALLLTGNWKKEAVNAIFSFPKLAVVKAVDCDSGRDIPLRSGGFAAEVMGRNFKIFLLELK